MDEYCKVEYGILIPMLFDIWHLNDGSIYAYIHNFDLEEILKHCPKTEPYARFRDWLITIICNLD